MNSNFDRTHNHGFFTIGFALAVLAVGAGITTGAESLSSGETAQAMVSSVNDSAAVRPAGAEQPVSESVTSQPHLAEAVALAPMR